MKTPPASSLPPAVGPGHRPLTLRPLGLLDEPSCLVHIYDAETRAYPVTVAIARGDTPAEAQANAAFIVHACNTHAANEARIAALAGALAEISNRAGNTEDDLSGAWAAQHALAALT